VIGMRLATYVDIPAADVEAYTMTLSRFARRPCAISPATIDGTVEASQCGTS